MLRKITNRYNNIPIPAKAALWFAVCNIALKGINFFTTPLFTRLLSTYEYGELSVFTSYEQLILVIATWEVSIGPYQRGLFKYKKDISVFTASTQLFANLLTCISFTLVFTFYDLFNYLTDLPKTLTGILVIYLFFQPAYNCWFYRKRIEYDYRKSVPASFCISLICIVTPVIAIMTINSTAEIKFAFTLIPAILIYAGLYFIQMKNTHLIKNRKRVFEYWKFFVRFTPPLVVHAISYSILCQADRIMISKMDSKENAAIYSVAYTIASMAIVIQNAVQQVLVPWVYQKLESKNYNHIKKNASIIFASVGIVYLLFILISPEVVSILYPTHYHEGIWCIPPIAIGSYFMLLYSMFVNVESYYEETKYIAYVSILCAALNIILNYVGIKLFGYIACAYTTLICYELFAVGHYVFMQKTLIKHVNGTQVYDVKQIFVISLVVIIAMTGITLLYPHIVIRYVVVAAISAVVIVNKKNIIEITSRISN